jgi:hypothetical protein
LLVLLLCVPQVLVTIAPRARDLNRPLEAVVPADLPVVAEDPHDFLPLVYNTRRASRPYYFLLDWDSAVDGRAPRRAAQDHILLGRWKRVGYLSDRIAAAAEFLCATPEFAVLHNQEFAWFERAIAVNPAFTTTRLGVTAGVDHSNEIILVRRTGALRCAQQRKQNP